MPEPCCRYDYDRDGNCHNHPADRPRPDFGKALAEHPDPKVREFHRRFSTPRPADD